MAFSPQGVEGDEAIAAAVQSPERFVLKPQREGGGKFICIFSKKTQILKTFKYTLVKYHIVEVILL